MDATELEIRNIIKLSPAWLLKECIAELVPTITDIVNGSLRDSLIPKSLKTALIRPLLKKTGLDSDILKNCRSVSILIILYLPQMNTTHIVATTDEHNTHCLYHKLSHIVSTTNEHNTHCLYRR